MNSSAPYPKPDPDAADAHLKRLTDELHYLATHVERIKGVTMATAFDVRGVAEDLAAWVQGVVDGGVKLR